MRCNSSRSPWNALQSFARRVGDRGALYGLVFGVLTAVLVGPAPAVAQAPPVINGDLSDLIPYVDAVFEAGNGCGVVREDLVEDIINNNFEANPFWPCSADSVVQNGQQLYFPNGFDQVLWAVAYDRVNDQTYLGIRTRGSIGDCNGDSNPDVPTEPCDPPPGGATTVGEEDGISEFDDTYRWNIDDNCDGIFEYRIEVYGPDPNNLTVEVNGVANPGAEAFYSGTELEVRVPGLGLSPIWSASTFTDCIPDALGEDPSPAAKCQEPRPSLEIEKTANPEVICPDEATTFTVTVTNTGSTPLTVSLEDELPADLVYANNVMGDFTVDTVNGQMIVFNDLEIPIGQSRSVSFDATAGENCFGTVTNTATAVGVFQDDCLKGVDNEEGVLVVGPMSATADVVCLDDPCVEVVCRAPQAACDGDLITIEADATNCSRGPEDITINIAGQETTFVDVPAGSTVTWSREVTHNCPEESVATAGRAQALSVNGESGVDPAVSYLVTATASNECGISDPAQSNCLVQCLPEPCVNVEASGPEAICSGDDVTITATATNCSNGAEDITINIAGQETTFVDVPSGASREYSATFEGVECEPGEPLNYDVTASATNACDTVEAETSVSVDCLPGACVELEASGPEEICSGDDVTINATATNCSQGAEDITINIAGQETTFVDVPMGESREFSATFEDVECVEGQDLTYAVTASATNTCNTVEQSTTVNVGCKPEPCVEITDIEAPEAICSGDDVKIAVTAQNCSNGPEDITINIAGQETTFVDVPSGESRMYMWTFEGVECVEGEGVSYQVSASATNDCGTVSVNETVNVACNPEPCVEVMGSGPESACEGAEIELCLKATNCSTGPEDITINIAGQETTFVDVPAEGMVEWCVTVTMPQCEQGQSISFDASATATNACGSITERTTISVRCDEPEVNIVKTSSVEEVDLGGTYRYTIRVTNPGPVNLENLTITDNLCDAVSYQNAATPTPDSEPAVGAIGGTIVWTLPSLAVGQSAEFSFDVMAETCDVTCVNEAIVEAFCEGSETSSITRRTTEDTPILCIADNCPRSPGYWSSQVALRGNGSQKYSKGQLDIIADCVRAESDWFDGLWGTDSFAGLKLALVPPRPMNNFKQLQRQYAALLSSYCTGQIEIINNKGQTVSLDPSTPINHSGVDARNIGELIEEIDDALLNGKSNKYGALSECADRINNGIGIPLGECGDDDLRSSSLDDSSVLGGTELGVESQIGGEEQLLQLYSPAPNPFTSTTRFAYAVPGAGSRVEIGIYNVAGRQVRQLVSGFQASGRYEVSWDGRDNAGIQMARGVYFIRAMVDGKRVGNAPRVILAR